jgi:hypothetical protein
MLCLVLFSMSLTLFFLWPRWWRTK